MAARRRALRLRDPLQATPIGRANNKTVIHQLHSVAPLPVMALTGENERADELIRLIGKYLYQSRRLRATAETTVGSVL